VTRPRPLRGPYTGRLHPLWLYQKLKRIALFIQKLLGGPKFGPQRPFPGSRDGRNLISWRWSLHIQIQFGEDQCQFGFKLFLSFFIMTLACRLAWTMPVALIMAVDGICHPTMAALIIGRQRRCSICPDRCIEWLTSCSVMWFWFDFDDVVL